LGPVRGREWCGQVVVGVGGEGGEVVVVRVVGGMRRRGREVWEAGILVVRLVVGEVMRW